MKQVNSTKYNKMQIVHKVKGDFLNKINIHNQRDVRRSPFAAKEKNYIQYDTVFGINKDVKGQLLIFNQDIIVFSVSRAIVIRDISKRTQKIIKKQGRFKNITVLNGMLQTSGTDKDTFHPFIMVGDSSAILDKNSFVVIINYKSSAIEFKTLNAGISGTVSQICIDNRKETVCAMIGEPNENAQIVIWKMQRDKVCAQSHLKYAALQISFNLVRPKQILILCEKHIKVWSINFQQRNIIEERSLIPSKETKSLKLLSHSWIMSKSPLLVVLAEELKAELVQNFIFIIEKDEVRNKVNIRIDEIRIKISNKKRKGIQTGQDGLGIQRLFQDMVKDNSVGKATQTKSLQMFFFNCFCNRIYNPNKIDSKPSFILGGSHGMIVFFEIEKKNYSLITGLTYSVDQQTVITEMSASSNQSFLTIIARNQKKQKFYFSLDTCLIDADQQALLPFFGSTIFSSPSYHSERVKNISCALMKSIFVSCSHDQTLKIWNYEQVQSMDKKCIQSFKGESNQQINGVSMHPFGLMLAVSFNKQFKIFAILQNGLQSIVNIKQNKFLGIKYANGGHFIITNQEVTLKVYDSIYYRIIHMFSIQDMKGRITDFIITPDDSTVIVVFVQEIFDKKANLSQKTGNCFVYRWVMHQELTHQMYSHKSQDYYLSCQYDPEAYPLEKHQDLFVAITTKKMVIYKKEITELLCQFNVSAWQPSTLLLSKELNTLFVGTFQGSIRLYPWPLDQTTCPYTVFSLEKQQISYALPQFYQFSFHNHEISSICLTDNRKKLAAGCDDGTIYLLKIVNLQDIKTKQSNALNKQVQDRKNMLQITNKLFLMNSKEVAQKNDRIRRNQMQIFRAQQNAKAQREKRQKEFQQNYEKKQKQFQSSLAHELKLKQEYIVKDKKQFQSLQAQYQAQLSEFQQKKREMMQQHRQRILYEQKRNKQIQQQIEKEKSRHQKALEEMVEQYKRSIYQLKKDFINQSQIIQDQYNKIVEEARSNGLQFIQKLKAQEFLQQHQIDQEMSELRQKIGKIKTSNEFLQERNRFMEQQFKELKNKDQQSQREFQAVFQRYIGIRQENLKNQQEILKMQHQLLQRLQVIDLKQQAWRSAKQYQVTLQNFRFLLDQKIRQLQDQKGQLMKKIKVKQQNLSKMFNQLMKQSNQNEAKERKISSLKNQISVIQNQIRQSELSIFNNLKSLSIFKNQIQQALQEKDEVKVAKRIKQLLQQLKKTKIQNPNTKVSVQDLKQAIKLKHEKGSDINQQLLKHNNWMNKKLHLMRSTFRKNKEIRQDNINIVLKQNQKLIQQCNLLRTQNDAYKKEICKAEMQLIETGKQHQKLKELKKQKKQSKSQPRLGQLQRKVQEQKEALHKQRQNLNFLLHGNI